MVVGNSIDKCVPLVSFDSTADEARGLHKLDARPMTRRSEARHNQERAKQTDNTVVNILCVVPVIVRNN